jgi:hypothetical protein
LMDGKYGANVFEQLTGDSLAEFVDRYESDQPGA